MERIKSAFSAYSEMRPRSRARVTAVIAIVLALLICLCISINNRVNMQREYAAVRTETAQSLYSNLYMLAQTFDMASVPNADVQNVILPQMKNYYVAAVTLNELMTNAYGARYRLLTEEDVAAIGAAFTAYETAFRSGAPTDLAQANMNDCMVKVRDVLASRFADGKLKAAR